MPSSDDLLYGKIALTEKFCTQQQIDECVRMQSFEKEPPPLGELLLFKSYITPEQHEKVLAIQRENLNVLDPLLKKRKEAVLFGKLAVQEKLLTEEQANECLRLQAKEGETRSIGEIMIDKRYLTPEQVKAVLSKQQKRIMYCPACKLSFTVFTLTEGKTVSCPRCKGPLGEGKPTASLRTDAEFATQVLRAVKAGLPPSARPDTRKVAPAAKVIKLACVICDQKFQGALDATGRVRCPHCQTTFTPR